MADVLLPPLTKVAQSQFHYVDSTGLTRGIYTGAVETTAYGGDRLAATLTLVPVGGRAAVEKTKRAAVLSMLASLRGRQNRIWMPDHSYQRRGSFPAGELLINNSFANGATGWASGSDFSLAASDNVLRAQRLAMLSSSFVLLTGVTPTQYAPHCFRLFRRAGRGTFSAQTLFDSFEVGGASGVMSDGLTTLAYVPITTGNRNVGIIDNVSTGEMAGDHLDVLWTSYSRCFLADNGPNILLQSDAFTSPWGTVHSSVVASGTAAPDGSATVASITDTAVNTDHYIVQSFTMPSGQFDLALCCAVKANQKGWVWLQIGESTGGTGALAYFNASTGAFGNTAAGANWSNVRQYVTSLGNGWNLFCIVARKTNAATSGTAYVGAANANGGAVYTGGANAALFIWRATLAQSSVPTRMVQSAGSAVAAAGQQGSTLYVKGLPINSNGLLLPGDQVQVGKQLCFVTASLDSNGAGLGYLQVSPPLRYAPADSDPVIVEKPMARFIFTGQFPQWLNVPGVSTTADLDFEEACEP